MPSGASEYRDVRALSEHAAARERRRGRGAQRRIAQGRRRAQRGTDRKAWFRGDRWVRQPPGQPDRIVRNEIQRVYQNDRRSGAGIENRQLRAGGFSPAAQSRAACGRDGDPLMAVNYDPALINKVFEVTEPVEVKADKI